ncbi:MAG: 4-(cytidine 5'-diphospho)-2-C-methyl-D-erythritol kinase [Nanoarchaeota archaeon]
MQLSSYAKVNLFLKVGKKLKSGYHNIESLMMPIQLHDNMHIEKISEDKIIVESNNPDLEGEENLAYKAASLLKEKFKIREGIKVHIEKNVPMSAGLGGGSSNAANVLVMANKLWGLKLTEKRLISLGAEIGSDVPFFIAGKQAVVEGIGDKIKPLKKSLSINLVLVNPGIMVSTSWAYSHFDKLKEKPKTKKSIQEIVKAIGKRELKRIAHSLHNDFEPMIEKKYKILKEIKTNLKKFGSLSNVMSGSGPTIIGLFDSIYPAREAYFKLKDLYPFVYLTKTF